MVNKIFASLGKVQEDIKLMLFIRITDKLIMNNKPKHTFVYFKSEKYHIKAYYSKFFSRKIDYSRFWKTINEHDNYMEYHITW